jgi:serine/threonine-protein kinase
LIGKTLGHYEITAQLGKGGMGEVYRARDTKLGREVAIKVLPKEMSGDPERVARFEREARLLASLQHAHIASIYGFEHDGGLQFLAMELVEGQTLEDRLQEGALSRDETLRIAGQMAAGLEAAHEKGVIHRDLKPANVMLTGDGDVKILDFGLARAWFGDAEEEDIGASPTITAAMTQAGTILGTAAYMSPEQARGKNVDRRADIWAFGAILWEMVTGNRLFGGETISDTLAAVIRAEPEWEVLPTEAQPRICHLIERCLVRDPRQRLRDIGEARILLQESPDAPRTVTHREDGPSSGPGWARNAGWFVAIAAVAVAAWIGLSPRPGIEPSPVMRFALSTDEPVIIDLFPSCALAISPGGDHVVIAGARRSEGHGLYVRSIGSDDAELLPGTSRADNPVFSPDGQWIAFGQDDKLKKISISGGPPVTLCDAPDMRGASWGTNGQIVFAPGRASGLMLVAESGGTPVALTQIEANEASLAVPSHRWPAFLPDGETVLFTRTPDDNVYDIADIVAVSVADGTQKVLVEGATYPKYAANGILLFLRQNTLFGARFSEERVELLGPPTPVLAEVAFATTYGFGQLAVSSTGLLVYLTDPGSRALENLVWLDRDGTKTVASAHERSFGNSRISPDGRRALVQVRDSGRVNLWMLEFARDSMTRFSFSEVIDRNPVWSPDGNWVVFSSMHGGASSNLFRKRSNGTGELERLTQSPDHQNPTSWSPDGKVVAFEQFSPDTAGDILLMRLDPDPQEPEVYLRTPFSENAPKISPDGEWIAYQSNVSGQLEIYVGPLSGSGGQVKVSLNGGVWPVWSPDGKELLYIDRGARKLAAVRYSVEDGEFVPELAREILDYPRTYGAFDVAGGPFRILTDESLEREGATQRPLTVLVNWFEELERKTPER